MTKFPLLCAALLGSLFVVPVIAQTNLFPSSGNVGIGTTAPTEQLVMTGGQSINVKQYAYAHFGSDYSAWSTIVGNNVRARHGQNNGMELASTYVALGASAVRLNWGVMEFHVAAPSDISTLSEGAPFSFPRMVINGAGNVGIGTTTPSAKLDVVGSLACIKTNQGGWYIYRVSTGAFRSAFYDDGSSTQIFGDGNGSTPAIAIKALNVGIGTTSPTHKLSVNGTIRAKEVIVDNTGWADHVFAADYRLAPLSAVEQHIQQNGHLPDVPSAAEVAARGVSIGEIQKILLQKIEELTLHQIEQEKRLNAQADRIRALETENAQLRTR